MSASKCVSTRPLSPFMLGKFYRLQLTSLLSIVHRITGVLLSVGVLGLTAWIVCVAAGFSAYAGYLQIVRSIPGQLLLAVWSWALFYHLCNGVRHLVWDAGYCLRIRQVYLAGWVVLVASVGLTAALWYVAFQS